MQVGVCFQCSRNLVSYEFVCQARTRVNFVIGEWQKAHNLMHSQSVQPGFIMRHSHDPSMPAPISEFHPLTGASQDGAEMPAASAGPQGSGMNASPAEAMTSQMLY